MSQGIIRKAGRSCGVSDRGVNHRRLRAGVRSQTDNQVDLSALRDLRVRQGILADHLAFLHRVVRKALSGFYYVDDGEKVVTCRARGKHRYNQLTPLVGDRVRFMAARLSPDSRSHLLTHTRLSHPRAAAMAATRSIKNGSVTGTAWEATTTS